jgi:hypothetical protein
MDWEERHRRRQAGVSDRVRLSNTHNEVIVLFIMRR